MGGICSPINGFLGKVASSFGSAPKILQYRSINLNDLRKPGVFQFALLRIARFLVPGYLRIEFQNAIHFHE